MRGNGQSGTATVLFTDVVGSTRLLSALGEEGFDELRRRHFAVLRRALGHHGGEEIKTLGDGILAVFTSATAAVECAVAMQQAVSRDTDADHAPLAVRVGLALGDVTFEDSDVFGTPVVEAARLVAAAGGGEVLATAVVRAAAGRTQATFVDRGLLELRGLPEPVPACEVMWTPMATTAVPLPPLLAGMMHVFVGREDELGRLAQAWKEAVAGELRVTFLAGEPGVGKTRLAAQLAQSVHGEQATVLAGACGEELGVPYQPFVEALRHLIDHSDPDELSDRLGRYPGELVRLVPELAQRVPACRPPSPPIPRRSATGSSTPWPAGWRTPRGTTRSCSSSTTCSGPPSRPCSCSATSPARPSRCGFSLSAPTGTPRSAGTICSGGRWRISAGSGASSGCP